MDYSEVSFEEILKSNSDTIYRICRVYAQPPIEAQDLFQEVAFQVWKSLPSFKEKANINTWVYRIALNVCLRSKLNLERKNKKTTRFEAIQFSIANLEYTAYDETRFQVLKECIEQLNEADTSLVVLYLEALSYKEIAAITGLTENHIAVKMKRIRKKLLECITPKLSIL